MFTFLGDKDIPELTLKKVGCDIFILFTENGLVFNGFWSLLV
jgi:hypothetical protein